MLMIIRQFYRCLRQLVNNEDHKICRTEATVAETKALPVIKSTNGRWDLVGSLGLRERIEYWAVFRGESIGSTSDNENYTGVVRI
jgi:hypothetical protein